MTPPLDCTAVRSTAPRIAPEVVRFALDLRELLLRDECRDPEVRQFAVACLLAGAPFPVRLEMPGVSRCA
jgi:hypothetical protein